jgi:hypothetical protein
MISDTGKEALSNELGKSIGELFQILSGDLKKSCVQYLNPK